MNFIFLLNLFLFFNILLNNFFYIEANNIINNNIYILIHGTWANKELWHSTDGNFFKKLSQAVTVLNSKLVTFEWEGHLNHETRLNAANNLIKFLEKYIDKNIFIVAHSHGANVGILASQLLSKQNKQIKIKAFYALGCPIDTKIYMPDMSVINYFYNFYSNKDLIQTVFGLYKRVLPAHDRIANICININGLEPGHCQTHSEIIAYWLPFIHDYFAKYKIGNFEKFNFSKSCVIDFCPNRPPVYISDNYFNNYIPEYHDKNIYLSF